MLASKPTSQKDATVEAPPAPRKGKATPVRGISPETPPNSSSACDPSRNASPAAATTSPANPAHTGPGSCQLSTPARGRWHSPPRRGCFAAHPQMPRSGPRNTHPNCTASGRWAPDRLPRTPPAPRASLRSAERMRQREPPERPNRPKAHRPWPRQPAPIGQQPRRTGSSSRLFSPPDLDEFHAACDAALRPTCTSRAARRARGRTRPLP